MKSAGVKGVGRAGLEVMFCSMCCPVVGSSIWVSERKVRELVVLKFGYGVFHYCVPPKNVTNKSVMSLCVLMRDKQQKQHSWSSFNWTQLGLIFSAMGVSRTSCKTCTKCYWNMIISCFFQSKKLIIRMLEVQNVLFLYMLQPNKCTWAFDNP